MPACKRCGGTGEEPARKPKRPDPHRAWRRATEAWRASPDYVEHYRLMREEDHEGIVRCECAVAARLRASEPRRP